MINYYELLLHDILEISWDTTRCRSSRVLDSVLQNETWRWNQHEPTMQCLNVIGYSCDITSEWFWPCRKRGGVQVMVIPMRWNHHHEIFWGELNFLQTLLKDAWNFTADDGKTTPKHMFSYMFSIAKLQGCRGSLVEADLLIARASAMRSGWRGRISQGWQRDHHLGRKWPGEAWRGLERPGEILWWNHGFLIWELSEKGVRTPK